MSITKYCVTCLLVPVSLDSVVLVVGTGKTGVFFLVCTSDSGTRLLGCSNIGKS